MKPKEELIDGIERDVEKKRKMIAMLDRIPVNLLSEVFPGHWYNCWIGDFEYCLPFDFALIEQVKQFMAEQCPEYELSRESRQVWDSSSAAGHFLYYRTKEEHWEDKASFSFGFRTSEKGTTCVLNKIGEKSVPVFEVICGEGAKETL